ncbi:TspO and MBR related proteins [Paenibacillaceae bacterium GAS479]|nr:TspO and MBR related proteins [Paenibacillaceae bacterium GAS479]
MKSPQHQDITIPVWLRFLNTVGFILMIAVNALAQLLPLAGNTTGELSDKYPVLITPPGYVFSIWSVIYVLLAGFIIYQWTRAGASQNLVKGISCWFFVNTLLNAGWIIAWHYEQLALSVLIMLLLLFTLIVIYDRVQQAGQSTGPGAVFLVQLPFSLYLGWISVATIVNVTVLLYDLGWNGFELGDKTWLIIGLVAAALVGILIGWLYRDPFFGLVQAWALSGIAIKEGTPSEASSLCWALVALLLASSVIQVWRRWRQYRL